MSAALGNNPFFDPELAPLAVRDWFVRLLPEPLQWLTHNLITIVAILAVFGLFFAFTTVAERLEPASLYDRFVAYRESLGWKSCP